MKKAYLFMFVGVIALAMIVISVMNFDPKVDTWSSLIAGAGIGFLIVKMPVILSLIRNRKKAQ